MHACSEDLEVFARHLDAAPANLFDTQVAAGFLSADYSPSYAQLVQRYAGVEIVKHQTRSYWLARRWDEQLHAVAALRICWPCTARSLRRCNGWVG
jgi:ribonuclease D